MTTPRGSYGGGYYASSAFPDTPIYDSLVAERGTPQIAPIRVPMPYESVSNLPALPALPALPPASSHHVPPPNGYPGPAPASYPQPAYQPQPAPAPYIPQQAHARGYQGGGYPAQGQPHHPGGNTGYDAVRPVPPRPVPPRPQAPGYGDDQYRRPYHNNHYNGQGY